ncbi:arabinofuranosidase catalytic domain-containing protein [Dactylosporangium matsuzakiense]|uniref:Alpha-L-arabinofuranosidase n=1 Tax=Dactylosporangium matsuzakiense TaxID=53360 RepID=A0A9W6NLQ8_9ACTN|nr:arabinofuranosidase catalytic domain-containing protein [Dactylosporangium matsuzakiense]GLL01421.1 hypothetical protein GCM10017581_031620 [Dactylosporangium matsuzakiense]
MLGVATAVALPGTAQAAGTLPCDIYAGGGTPCVAAHSTTRALFGSYNSALYQVRRLSDGATANIGVLSAGGYANAAAQDSFCSGTYCTIVRIYDQTARHNDLTIAPGGGANPTGDQGASAAALPVSAGGHKVYGVYISAGNGYRNNATNGVATGSQPEGILGIGGDNSNGSVGSFFEGVMTSGYPSDATENSVQANIVSVGYSKSVSFPANGGVYRLTNLASGKVLDAVNCGTANGTGLQMWDNLNNACQLWSFSS